MRTVINGTLAALLVLSLGAVVGLTPAHASEVWCFGDPTVALNADIVQVDIGVNASPAEVDKLVLKAETTFYVPRGTLTKKIGVTRVPFPESVRFMEVAGATSTTIAVTFNAKKELPAAVAITINGTPYTKGKTTLIAGRHSYTGTTSTGVTVTLR